MKETRIMEYLEYQCSLINGVLFIYNYVGKKRSIHLRTHIFLPFDLE